MLTLLKTWLKEIRANFLILAVVLVMIGGAAAWHDNMFNIFLFVLTVLGVTAAHISVNLFNEYSDWKTGIDDNTVRTPFSGGSGNLQEGLLEPGHVNYAAWITLSISFFIGLYLAWVSGWPVLVLMAAGGIATVFYTDYLTRWMVGEIIAGATLGSFVVIGAYYVQTMSINSAIVWASIPPGILTMLLLFLNEFPDAEADRAGGRRHLVIILGKTCASILYAALLVTVYAVLAAGVVRGVLPGAVILGLLTFPVALGAGYRTLRYAHNSSLIVSALGLNVVVVLVTDFLIALGFVIG